MTSTTNQAGNMAIRDGQKLINFWGDPTLIDNFKKKSIGKGYFPSRVLWILIGMWLDGKLDEAEIDERYQTSTKDLRDRRTERIRKGWEDTHREHNHEDDFEEECRRQEHDLQQYENKIMNRDDD